MQLSITKKEKEDLEKQVNNCRLFVFKFLAVVLMTTGTLFSQDTYRKGGTYVIDTVTVVGLENFSDDVARSKKYLDHQTKDLSSWLNNINMRSK